mgnify:CR=1 FL=1
MTRGGIVPSILFTTLVNSSLFVLCIMFLEGTIVDGAMSFSKLSFITSLDCFQEIFPCSTLVIRPLSSSGVIFILSICFLGLLILPTRIFST